MLIIEPSKVNYDKLTLAPLKTAWRPKIVHRKYKRKRNFFLKRQLHLWKEHPLRKNKKTRNINDRKISYFKATKVRSPAGESFGGATVGIYGKVNRRKVRKDLEFTKIKCKLCNSFWRERPRSFRSPDLNIITQSIQWNVEWTGCE